MEGKVEYSDIFKRQVMDANPDDQFVERALREGSLELGRILKKRTTFSIANTELYAKWRKLYREFLQKNRSEAVC